MRRFAPYYNSTSSAGLVEQTWDNSWNYNYSGSYNNRWAYSYDYQNIYLFDSPNTKYLANYFSASSGNYSYNNLSTTTGNYEDSYDYSSRQGGEAVGFIHSDVHLGHGSNNLALNVASGLSSVGIDESSLISGNGNDSITFSIKSNSGISNFQRSKSSYETLNINFGSRNNLSKYGSLYSYSNKNVIRGLHFQKPPFEQGKLLTVISGTIFDVVVDIRSTSKNFGKHLKVKLAAGDGNSIFVPPGFAHGFCSLDKENYVVYNYAFFYVTKYPS